LDPQREIERLVAFEGRGPGTDAERRAAAHLADRLEGLGREVEVQPFFTWPAWPVTHALHAVLGIVGSVVAVEQPAVGVGLVLLAAVLTFLDLSGRPLLVRRLLGRRASQNVVSPESSDRPGTLVLIAHYDVGRGGAVFSRRAQERRAVLGRLLRRPIGLFEPLFWSLMVILVCAVVRLTGIDSVVLTAVQFVPTVVLIVYVPLLVDIALSGRVPGAGNNASGVATVLRLAERHGDELDYFDLWVVLVGAGESLEQGSRAWLRANKDRLPRDSTVVLALDGVANGTVRWMAKDGYVVSWAYHPELLRLCEEVADESARRLVSRWSSDALPARTRGYPAVAIACRSAIDNAPNDHQETDTPDRVDPEALERAFAFCSELIGRIDDRLGPQVEAAVEERD
jgi:hypothetical protein